MKFLLVALLLVAAVTAQLTGTGAPTVRGPCIEDVYEANKGGSLGCTANDIQVASVTDIEGLPETCQVGDSLTFTATYEVLLTATKRYDVGLYFGADQDNALRGTCIVGILPVSGDSQIGVSDEDGDGCGDINNKLINPVFVRYTVTTKCQDTDGDNQADLPYCSTWRQRSRDPCSTEADAYPGAPSKCLCASLPLIPICNPCTITGLESVERACSSDFGPQDGDVTVTGPCEATYSDAPFTGNCGTFERTWSVTDVCSGDVLTHTQNVVVVDDTMPELSCTEGTATCPGATATDNCDGAPTVARTESTVSQTFSATDSCGNTVSKTCTTTCA